MVHAVNSIIDIHEGRLIAGLYNRIPDSIWLTLFTITALTMITMGAQVGFSKSRKLIAVLPLILAFTALATIIIDLDRPQGGDIRINQKPMLDLLDSIQE